MTKLYLQDNHDTVEFDFKGSGHMFITTSVGLARGATGTSVYLTVGQIKELRKALKLHLIATGHKELK